MARKIGISVGDHIYKKVIELVQRGEFSTPSEVAKTALIEWLKEREDIMAPGRSVGEHTREEILFTLYLRKAASKEEINLELAKKGLEQEPEQLDAHLFILEKAGKIEEKDGRFVVKKAAV